MDFYDLVKIIEKEKIRWESMVLDPKDTQSFEDYKFKTGVICGLNKVLIIIKEQIIKTD